MIEKMKNVHLIFLVAITYLCLFSCSDLDVDTTDRFPQDKTWENKDLIDLVLVHLYDGVELEATFDYWGGDWDIMGVHLANVSDEAASAWPGGDFSSATTRIAGYGAEWFSLWEETFDNIRACNVALENIEKTTALDETTRVQYTGEVRFIRAFHYFNLVKRYGGVPIIVEPQEYTGPESLPALQVKRDTEKRVYDFIISELDEAVKYIPATQLPENRARATRYSAFALQSRVALYAASITKYGTIYLNGIVGIEGSADDYWKKAIAAADSIIDSGLYELYDKGGDKSDNFRKLFLEKNNFGKDGNQEYIFWKEYVSRKKGHSMDRLFVPFSSIAIGYGNGYAPTLNLIEAFEYKDGSDGKLKLTGNDGSLIRYDTENEIFKDKDPRLRATVYLPGDSCRGKTISVRRGIYDDDKSEKYQYNNNQKSIYSYTDTNGIIKEEPYHASDGIWDAYELSPTGFYLKKFADESIVIVNEPTSNVPWPVFRLAEIYLNKAEAAIELGQIETARIAINKIRNRAGIKLLDASEVTIDKVRNERRVELAYESHRFWDVRRWRIATDKNILGEFSPMGLYPWYSVRDGKYLYTSEQVKRPIRRFEEKNYYLRISDNDMGSNPALAPNNPFY